MPNRKTCRIYEQLGVRECGDGPIRPGGLALTQRAISLCSLGTDSRVLDIGCGTGATLRYLIDGRGLRAVGVDPSAILLSEGRRKNEDLPVMRARGEHLPFADAVMDCVLAECSLSVTEDVGRVLGECARVLRDNGLLLVNDVYARNPEGISGIRSLPVECCLTGAVSKEEWISRLEARGFEVRLWEDHSSALKDFAARLIFSHGSMEAFWRGSMGYDQKTETHEAQCAIAKAKPGYFLMIAHKTQGASRQLSG